MHQKIVVSGVLTYKGKVLLVKRAPTEKFLPGNYEFPGGKVDFGETVDEALKREFQEETQLVVDVEEFIRSFSYVTGERHTVELVFFVSSESQEVQLSADHTDAQWVEPEKAVSLKISDQIMRTLEIIARFDE